MTGCLCRVFTLFHPVQLKKGPPGRFFVAKRLFQCIWGLFLTHLGPNLGHFGSDKWAKLVSLNVLGAVPTLFQPVPLNRWSHMALLVKMPIWALFGPWEDPNMKNATCSSWNRGQCTYWDQKKPSVTMVGHFHKMHTTYLAV